MTSEVTFKQWTCVLQFGRYQDGGRTAIELMDKEDGGRVAVATVNIPEFDVPEGHVLIKNWSENTGLLPALIEAGIVEVTDIVVAAGYANANLCKLLVEVPEDA